MTGITFDLEKLKDLTVLEMFHAMIGGRFAPLLVVDSDNMKLDTFTNNFSTTVTDRANKILGKSLTTKKLWVTDDILQLFTETQQQESLPASERFHKYKPVKSHNHHPR